MAQQRYRETTPPLRESHEATQHYNNRMPSPPRLVIPPSDGTFGFPFKAPAAELLSQPAPEDFLKTLQVRDFSKLTAVDWEYENRRKAQQIVHFIYLGSWQTARDQDFLRSEGITMLLGIRNVLTAETKFGLLNSAKVADQLGIKSANIDVSGNQDLIAAYPRAIETVNNHMLEVYRLLQPTPGFAFGKITEPIKHGKVLIFCETGNGRSAGVVAAYLMAMYDLSLQHAVQCVQSQRFCAGFDDELKYYLSSYRQLLDAQRDVGRSSRRRSDPIQADPSTGYNVDRSEPSARGRSKRRLDDLNDGNDTEMGNGIQLHNEDRFQRREGIAPFVDM